MSNSNGQLNSKPFNSIWLTLNSNSLGVNYGCADLIKEMVYQGVEINTDYTELKFTSIWFLLFLSKSLALYIMPFQNELAMNI